MVRLPGVGEMQKPAGDGGEATRGDLAGAPRLVGREPEEGGAVVNEVRWSWLSAGGLGWRSPTLLLCVCVLVVGGRGREGACCRWMLACSCRCELGLLVHWKSLAFFSNLPIPALSFESSESGGFQIFFCCFEEWL